MKELIWGVEGYGNPGATRQDSNTNANPAVGMNDLRPTNGAQIILNGHDRFAQRSGEYFTQVQPYQHHTRIPRKPIHVYSFAMKPEDPVQPSGTCNFSRIDNAQLRILAKSAGIIEHSGVEVNSTRNNGVLRIYAPNWNVLRIMSGMGGLAYSN